MISQLSLHIEESVDCKSILIKDTSVYNTKIQIECAELLVTPPGFEDTYSFKVDPGFYNSYMSLDFETNSCEKDIYTLQDGIYQLRYQICPTDKLFVEYNHLRQCSALNMYYEGLCSLNIGNCELKKEQQEKADKLREIKTYLDAAKSYVEFCNAPDKGLELHNYAIEKLKKLNLNCKNC